MNTSPVSILTGAGKGIGRATAIELARQGYRLILAARTQSDLEETARLAASPGIHLVPGDVRDPAFATRLVAAAQDHFGRIDAIINNAGYAPALSIEELTADEWHRIIDTNLSAAVHLTRAAWAALKQSQGAVVNISSFAARDPFPGLGAYGAAKAGLNLLSLALAREGAPHGIRVHTLALAAVETQMFRQLVTPEQYARDKALEPEDIACAIADCLTGAMKYTSGEVLYLRKAM